MPFDRGYGRATQHIAGDGGGSPLVIEFLWGDATEQPEPEPEAIEVPPPRPPTSS